MSNWERQNTFALQKHNNEEALEYCKILDDEFSMSYILFNSSSVVDNLGNREKSISLAVESERLCRKIGNKIGLSWGLFWQHGNHTLEEGKLDKAEQRFKEIYDIHAELGYKSVFLSVSLSHLGLVECFRGNIEQAGHYAADTISIALDINNAESKTWAFTLLGFLSLLEENYVQSRQYLNLALENLWIANLDMQIGLALVHYAQEDYQEGQIWLKKILYWLRSPLREVLYALLCIVTQSLYLAHHDENEKAVEYLGLAFTHSVSPSGFLQGCPLFTNLRDDLKEKLSENSYDEAWERGKLLDVEVVIRQMKEEYSEDA